MEDELQEFRNSKFAGATRCDGKVVPVGANSALNKADKAESAFSRILHRTTGINRSALTANSRESAKLVELANLSRNAKIEAKLKALEARIAIEGEDAV